MATPFYISCDIFFVRIVQMRYYHNKIFVRMVADATASRSPIKRSILNVCEHLADKLDAADAPLSQKRLYDALYISILRKTYIACLRILAQARHTHDVARKCYNEATTCVELDILDVDLEALNATVALSIGTE